MATRSVRGTRLFHRELAAGAVLQFALLLLLDVSVGLGLAGWLAGAVYAAGLTACLAIAGRRSSLEGLGPANRVTLTRAVLVGGVAALVADGVTGTAVLVAIAVVALSLDAVDGYVARRTRTETPLGARFDMEVDAFLILLLSVLVATSLGGWVLAIGAMRYAFVAAAWLMPWLREPLRPSFARKAVAALQGIVLVIAGSGLVAHQIAVAAVACALTALTWSFGRDIAWLWRSTRHRMTLLGAAR